MQTECVQSITKAPSPQRKLAPTVFTSQIFMHTLTDKLFVHLLNLPLHFYRAHISLTHIALLFPLLFFFLGNVGMSFNIEKICDFIFEKIYDSFIILFIELSFRHLLN